MQLSSSTPQYGIPENATLAVMQPNSFSDQVAKRLQERQSSLKIQYYTSVPEAYEQGMAASQYVLLPFENSGSDPSVVWKHIDLIHNDPTAVITGEVHHNVVMCVGAIGGMCPEAVQKVRTHPKAMDQCSRYLDQFMPLERQQSDSTAAGLELIAERNESGVIGLGTREAIEAAGLIILDDSPSITNLPPDQNITQFFLVHKNGGSVEPQYEMQRHAALLRLPKGGPGTLAKALHIMKTAGVNLTSLHSRTEDPTADVESARYEFFAEMERTGSPGALQVMQSGFDVLGDDAMRWLGSWNDNMGSQLEATQSNSTDELRRLCLDLDNRYQRLLLEPNNRQGVLCDILTVIGNSRVDISHLQSRNVGPKRYIFDLILDQSTTSSPTQMRYMADALHHSGYLRQSFTVGSSNDVSSLRQERFSLQ